MMVEQQTIISRALLSFALSVNEEPKNYDGILGYTRGFTVAGWVSEISIICRPLLGILCSSKVK